MWHVFCLTLVKCFSKEDPSWKSRFHLQSLSGTVSTADKSMKVIGDSDKQKPKMGTTLCTLLGCWISVIQVSGLKLDFTEVWSCYWSLLFHFDVEIVLHCAAAAVEASEASSSAEAATVSDGLRPRTGTDNRGNGKWLAAAAVQERGRLPNLESFYIVSNYYIYTWQNWKWPNMKS
jgi:hypothetical protein